MEHESLRDLHPALADEEQKVAEENLDRYLELAWEIYQAMQSGNLPIDG